MKNLIDNYRKKLQTIAQMIDIERDIELVAKLKTKANCYREFISHLNIIIKNAEINSKKENMELFLECLSPNYQQKKRIYSIYRIYTN